MTALYFLIPLALLFAAGALAVFIVSVRKGQFDDLDTPPVRILFDDPPAPPAKETSHAR